MTLTPGLAGTRLATTCRRIHHWLRRGKWALTGRRPLTPEEIRQQVGHIRWYHSIDLGHGIVTPGIDNSKESIRRIGLPQRLDGWTVLDVGAWDGFYSFEAERRGALRVLATDSYCWCAATARQRAEIYRRVRAGDHRAWSTARWSGKAGFDLARRALGSRVESQPIDILDLSPRRVGIFDLVLCLGVLYHMRHPLLALEHVASVTRKLLILETHVDLLDIPRPAMAFYPGSELNNDATNWCGPNPPMVLAMLRDVGFTDVSVFSGPFVSPLSTRMVFHAWR
ncbi:MAG: class I SAM-dependent methyltransferase [Gemmataceae bacterium]|nr:class I SAM-dependent methyltransferase [Gemmataceae bacterium]MDW8266199.1 class I SAM-dependent methyltransferase [Gemmataceae bacterium]